MKLSLPHAFLLLSLALNFATTSRAAESCRLTEEDLAANTKLSFDKSAIARPTAPV